MAQILTPIAFPDAGFDVEVMESASAYLVDDRSALVPVIEGVLKALGQEFAAEDPIGRVKVVHNPEDGSSTIVIRLGVRVPTLEAMERERKMERAYAEHCDKIPPTLVISVYER